MESKSGRLPRVDNSHYLTVNGLSVDGRLQAL